jgi:DNA-binding transcriptional LysR family regulator
LVKEGPTTVESLRAYGFIVREQGSGPWAAMEKFLTQARMEPRVIMEMASNETIKQAVIAGMGIMFLVAAHLATGTGQWFAGAAGGTRQPRGARLELRTHAVQSAFPGGASSAVCLGENRMENSPSLI